MPTPYKLTIISGMSSGTSANLTVGIYPATVDPLQMVQATGSDGKPEVDGQGNPVMIRANQPIASFSVLGFMSESDAAWIARVQQGFYDWTTAQADVRAFEARSAQYATYVLNVTDETT